MNNGYKIKSSFPYAEIKFYTNLSGIKTVDVDFKDNVLNGTYSKHTFSRDWWDSEVRELDNPVLGKVLEEYECMEENDDDYLYGRA